MRTVQSSDVEVDGEIAELVQTVREAKDQIEAVKAELEPVIDAAKDRIGYLLAVRGENWKDDQGYAQLRAAATRTTWDTDGLNALIKAHPDQYGWLLDFRKTTTGDPQVTVK